MADRKDDRKATFFVWFWSCICAFFWRFVVEQIGWLILREKLDGLRREQFHIDTAPSLCFRIEETIVKNDTCEIALRNAAFFVRQRLLHFGEIKIMLLRDEKSLRERGTYAQNDHLNDPWMSTQKTNNSFVPSSQLLAFILRLQNAVALAGCTVQCQHLVVADDLLVCDSDCGCLLTVGDHNQIDLRVQHFALRCCDSTESIVDACAFAISLQENNFFVRADTIDIVLIESLGYSALQRRYGGGKSESKPLGFVVSLDVLKMVAKVYAGERRTMLSLDDARFCSVGYAKFAQCQLSHELTENGDSAMLLLNQFDLRNNQTNVSNITLSVAQRQIGRLYFSPSTATTIVCEKETYKVYTAVELSLTIAQLHVLLQVFDSLQNDLTRLFTSAVVEGTHNNGIASKTIIDLCGFSIALTIFDEEFERSSLEAKIGFDKAQITSWQTFATVLLSEREDGNRRMSRLEPTIQLDLVVDEFYIADRVHRSHYRYLLYCENEMSISYDARARYVAAVAENLLHSETFISIQINLGDTVALCLHRQTARFLSRLAQTWSSLATSSAPLEHNTVFNKVTMESVQVEAFQIVFNYKPETLTRTCANIAEHGQFAYALGSVPIEDAVMRFDAVSIQNSSESLLKILQLAYVPQWDHLSTSLFAGVQPLRIAINLGDAVLDLIRLPLGNYNENDAYGDGSSGAMQSIAVELLTLGSRLGTVGYKALGGKHIDVQSTSFSSNQPRSFRQGRKQAWRLLKDNCASAVFAVTSDPARVYAHSGGNAAETALSVARGLPRLVTRPLAGVAGAIVKLSQGAKNKLDPTQKQKSDRKWR
jgi:hypothetical protein